MTQQWYITEVNKGSISVKMLGPKLNQMRQNGYRLAHVFEQHGNTVLIYEWAGVPQ